MAGEQPKGGFMLGTLARALHSLLATPYGLVDNAAWAIACGSCYTWLLALGRSDCSLPGVWTANAARRPLCNCVHRRFPAVGVVSAAP